MNPCWIDRLGDRLDQPERVAPEYQHLIPDDQQRIKRLLEVPIKGRVLEVGCGDGAMTRRIVKAWPEATVVATDRQPGPTVDRLWDIREPWKGRGEFDALYCCEVLEHLTFEDVERAMANLVAVLKPGGTFICSVPNQQPALHYVAGCRDRWKWPDHRSWWRYDELALLLEHHQIIRNVFHPLYPFELAQDSIWLMASGIKK